MKKNHQFLKHQFNIGLEVKNEEVVENDDEVGENDFAAYNEKIRLFGMRLLHQHGGWFHPHTASGIYFPKCVANLPLLFPLIHTVP